MKALLIGNMQDSSIINELRINRVEYKTKILSSSPSNWNTTIEMIDEFDFIIWKLTEVALMISSKSEYLNLFEAMGNKLKQKNHIILLYECNLNKKYSYINKRNLKKYQLLEINDIYTQIDKKIEYLIQADLTILTYKYAEHISKLVQNYIIEEISGLILKFYIPKERLMSREMSKMTEVFEEYINAILQRKVTINKIKTKDGVLIEFYSDEKDKESIIREWENFPGILDIFSFDSKKTKEIISKSKLSDIKKDELFHLLTIESKRILADLKYEFNRKQIELNYLIENQVIEGEIENPINEINFETIRKIQTNKGLQLYDKNIETLNYTYINKIEGNIINNETDHQLFNLIKSLALESKKTELIGNVNELNDPQISNTKKTTAVSKIKTFLIKNSDKIGDIGFNLLMKYIENK